MHTVSALKVPVPIMTTTSAPSSLDDLAAMTSNELLDLYISGRTPSVRDLEGDLNGRMLAVLGAGTLVGSALRAFAGWRLFPWRGKTFRSLGPDRGEGINRVFSDTRPRRWFRFETSVGPSRAGAFDAVQLDYDNPRLRQYMIAMLLDYDDDEPTLERIVVDMPRLQIVAQTNAGLAVKRTPAPTPISEARARAS